VTDLFSSLIGLRYQLSVYGKKPERFLEQLYLNEDENPACSICCAGFELEAWRCKPFANHLIEWLPEYALPEEELSVDHGNMYVKLQQAAVRVYTSKKYEKRGEAVEIALHAICREFFGTIPISPRVFYKSSSNDVIKSFDMVHARLPAQGGVELWLGESKLYEDADSAISDAISSVKLHLDQGFLEGQKLILGPQIPRNTPRYEELAALFKSQTSLDHLLGSAVFVIGVTADSDALEHAKGHTQEYQEAVRIELSALGKRILASKLTSKIKILLVYVPLGSKAKLVEAFDAKLKGLQ
jgi:hypothetical protein